MIFHAALPEEWDDDAPEYTPGGFAADGFIHCSTARQLASSVNRFLGDRECVVLLRIDDAGLGSALRWEPGSLGEDDLFPHLYGPLPRRAVERAEMWPRAADGAYRAADLTAPLET